MSGGDFLSDRLDDAQRAFQGGEIERAARILGLERTKALNRIGRGGAEDLTEIDGLADGMRAHLKGLERSLFDAAIASGKSPDPAGSTRIGDRGPALWITSGVLALMAIGAFGPWAKVLGVTVSGTDGSNDGWLVVAAAALAGLFIWGYAYNGSRGLSLLAGLAGVGGFATALHDRRHITHASALIQVGWGLNLDLVASVLLVVMAVVLASRSSPARDAASRLERLTQLRERGLISTEEYERMRAEILADI